MKSYNFFALVNRLKYIHRWGLMRSSNPENTAEHSLCVAVLAHALALIDQQFFGGQTDPNAVAVLALYHDAPEVLLGDLPTPVKYNNPEINAAFRNLESVATLRLLSMLPTELQPAYEPLLSPDRSSAEHIILKTADKLSAYIKCLEEQSLGNNEFDAAAQTIYKDLTANPSPALKYFLDNFLEAFKQSLDEISR